MSTRPKIKDKIQQELAKHDNDPKKIRKLILDGCSAPLEGLSAKFSELEQLSLTNVGLTTLKDFPHLPKFKKLALSDNNISGGLDALEKAKLDQLQILLLGGNKIKDLSELSALKSMKKLQFLDLFGCPVAEMKDYREKVFEMLPQVKYLDGVDKEGNEAEVVSDEDEEDDNGEGEGEAEGEIDDDGEDEGDGESDDEDEDEGEGEGESKGEGEAEGEGEDEGEGEGEGEGEAEGEVEGESKGKGEGEFESEGEDEGEGEGEGEGEAEGEVEGESKGEGEAEGEVEGESKGEGESESEGEGEGVQKDDGDDDSQEGGSLPQKRKTAETEPAAKRRKFEL
jgi:acidic leucine-rich nuclear phosphoprotein 32 family protein A/C/D